MRTAVIHHGSVKHPEDGSSRLILASAVDGKPLGTAVVHADDLHEAVLDMFDGIYHQANESTAFHITDATVRRMLTDSAGSFPNATFPSIVAGPMSRTWDACQEAITSVRLELDPPKANQPPSDLMIGTDASMQRRQNVSGLGFATSRGRVMGCARTDNDILDAEMHAIIFALGATSGRFGKVTVFTDNRWAVKAAEEGAFPNRARANQLRTALADFRRRTGADVAVEWVRGHSGEPLNEAAHRAAVAARRCQQWRLPTEKARDVFNNISQDLEPLAGAA